MPRAPSVSTRLSHPTCCAVDRQFSPRISPPLRSFAAHARSARSNQNPPSSRYLSAVARPLARPLTSVPLSPRRSPHALAAYTRSPHALAARARLCSYHSQSAGDGSPQCSGPAYHPAGRSFMPTRPRPFTTRNARGSTRFVNTLHTIHHAGSPLSRPPRSLHPRPSRVGTLGHLKRTRSPLATAQLPSYRCVRLPKRGASSPRTWLALLRTLRRCSVPPPSFAARCRSPWPYHP